jgi:hypothetical protein
LGTKFGAAIGPGEGPSGGPRERRSGENLCGEINSARGRENRSACH